MSIPSKIDLTEGSGAKKMATFSISESAETKELQRNVLVDSAGAELIGSKADATSVPVTQSSEDKAVLAAMSAKLPDALGANGGLKIEGVASGTVVPVSAPTGASATQIQGTAAAGSAAANNPVLQGGKAVSTLPAVVDANDATPLLTDLRGRLLITEIDNSLITEGNTATITDTTVTEVIGAAGAGTKWCITAIGVYNSDAAVGTWVKVQDDTAGTPVVYWRGYCAPGGGGFNLNFSPPLPAKGQANGKINVVAETTSAEIGCSVSAFKIPE